MPPGGAILPTKNDAILVNQMHYEVHSPSPALSGFIKCYWSLEGEDLSGTQQRVFPDGCVELVFHYGDLFSKYHDDGKCNTQPRSFIHGQLTRFIQIGGSGKAGIFGIRFKPYGLKPFIQINTHEINDDNVPVNEIWGAAGRELENRIIDADSNKERIQIAEHFLLQKLRPSTAMAINRCVTIINGSNGSVNIDHLSAQVNLGRRHLERQFIACVGLSPKQYARITRFQYVLSLAEQKRYDALTELAYDGGFYDQAHFIKDFRTFTGLSPKQYFSQHLPLVKFFSSE